MHVAKVKWNDKQETNSFSAKDFQRTIEQDGATLDERENAKNMEKSKDGKSTGSGKLNRTHREYWAGKEGQVFLTETNLSKLATWINLVQNNINDTNTISLCAGM